MKNIFKKILAIYVTFLGATLIINIFIDKENNFVNIFNIFIVSLSALSWSLKQFKK